MFDLESAIADWKHTLHQEESVSQGDIVELESHLREGIAELAAIGLSQREAFMVASARLGDHSTLNTEYRKVNGVGTGRQRVFWMVLGFFGGTALKLAISGISTCIGTLSAYVGWSGAPAGAAVVIASAVCWSTLMYLVFSAMNRSVFGQERNYASVGWLAVIAAIMAAGSAMGMVGNVVHAKIASMQEVGEAMRWAAIGGWAIQIGVVTACIGIIGSTSLRAKAVFNDNL